MTSQNASLSPRLPQRQRGKLRVEALLEAAGAVFAEKGFDAATMTEIAARAGSSIGSLYQFFPTKELVAEALLGRYAEAIATHYKGFAEETAALGTEDFADRLLLSLVKFRTDHPAYVALGEAMANLPHPPVLGLRRQLREAVSALLAARAPSLPPDILEGVAATVQQMMKSAVALRDDAVPAPAALAELGRALRLYLRDRLTLSGSS
jgi:AcrR family transcriptional regulator